MRPNQDERRFGAPWPAPAKLNLFLHVVGRRPDGFHELQTVFQFLDWCDWLAFAQREDGRLMRQGNEGVPSGSDLVTRAAGALRERSGTKLGADIRLDKCLPVGGGLGGGSSDAATTLVALNELWGTGLSTESLVRLGRNLGADVPVFVHGRAAFAEGIGERLTPVEPAESWYVVVDPGESVSTRGAFAAPELTRNTPRMTITRFAPDSGRNDLEPVVCARYPAVRSALEWLGARAPARMTGSGACVFAAFGDRETAERAARDVPAAWRARVARGMNRSPLAARLARERG